VTARSMQIIRGKVVKTYDAETSCPYCQVSKLRWDIEFEAATIKDGQAIDSSYAVKNICGHCLTVSDEPEKMDFICAKCDQLTPCIDNESGTERELFQRLFSYGKDGKFSDFFQYLTTEGLKKGKRYCMSCVYKVWRGYAANPQSLRLELEKPKPNYALKT
jgi:hypothetical protein